MIFSSFSFSFYCSLSLSKFLSSLSSSENKSGVIGLSLSFFKFGKFLSTISTLSIVVKSNFKVLKFGIVDKDFVSLK